VRNKRKNVRFRCVFALENALWSGKNDIDDINDISASNLTLEQTLSGKWRENGNSFWEGNPGAAVDKCGGGDGAVSDGARDDCH
jgi:hypothetical protein